jgi:threonine dehydrogenase-like Zn-dependent dehydrogenase
LRSAGVGWVMVAGTDADQRRLEIAERLGADVVVNVGEQDPVAAVKEVADDGVHVGLDLVFEATGNPESVRQGLDMVKAGGKVILVGIHSGLAEFNPTELVRGQKSIIGAYGYEPDTWRRALGILSSGRIPVGEIITHTVPLSGAREGFDLAVRREAAKVVFIPG